VEGWSFVSRAFLRPVGRPVAEQAERIGRDQNGCACVGKNGGPKAYDLVERFFSKLKRSLPSPAASKSTAKTTCSRQTRFSPNLDALYESVS